MTEKALSVIEQREVEFYGDDVTAVRMEDGAVYVPVRPICDLLGVQWSAQSKRIKRDPVLSDASISVSVMDTQGESAQHRNMTCLPLKYLSGFLFTVSSARVKPELREKVIRYQRECYEVLAEAFAEGRLTSDPSFTELLHSDSPAVQAYKMAQAIMQMARQQILLESRLDSAETHLSDHDRRIETIEATLGASDRYVTADQAMQVSQSVKAIAIALSQRSGRNEFGGVYGELYRQFGITSYKQLPAAKFDEAMNYLRQWHQALTDDSDSKF
jgi:hypothetical protein